MGQVLELLNWLALLDFIHGNGEDFLTEFSEVEVSFVWGVVVSFLEEVVGLVDCVFHFLHTLVDVLEFLLIDAGDHFFFGF